jgi:uncharacterized cupredoxin-like copper-binding protein
MTRVLRSHRLLAVVSAAIALLVPGGAVAVADAPGRHRAAPTGATVQGPGVVTLTIDVDHSRFTPAVIRVRPHTDVRFLIVNHDPIGHEFIVGGPEVHARHANGHEANHPPVPGEVSVPADARASTTYSFHAPGTVEFACHLPGHYRYGMHGNVVVAAEPR